MPDRTVAARRRVSSASWRPGPGDLVGFAIVAGLLVVALGASRGDRSTFITLLAGCVASWVAGRLLSAGWPLAVPIAVAVAAVAFAIVAAVAGGAIASAPGAALTQAAVACAIVAARASGRGALAAVVAGAVLLGVAAPASGIAGLSVAAVLLAAPALLRPAWTRTAVVCIAVVFVAALAASVTAAAGGRSATFAGAFGDVRLERWHAAWTIMVERPGGVGPGRFDNVPPRFLPDGGARHADHDFLEQGAELGWIGFALTAALFVWGFATLLPIADGSPAVAFAAASVGALGLHALFEPVLHVAAVPVLAAALLGTGRAVASRPATTSR